MEYWGVLLVIILLTVYYFINRAYAKRHALELMLYIEKKAEIFGIKAGREKYEWVVSRYDKLPEIIKFALTEEAFSEMIQNLFDEAMSPL